MKHGFSILDADLHVIEPYDLYLKYMDPKWGDRIPCAEPRKLNVGELHDFKTADGSPARKPWREAPPQAALTASSSSRPITRTPTARSRTPPRSFWR